jgi:uncharacterized membrane protein YfcA
MAGFGFGIAVMPFMLLLYPPKVAVAITPVITMLGLLIQWTRVRHDADKQLAGRLILGAVVGIPLGTLVLVAINPVHLKLLIGVAVVVAITLQVAKGRTDGPPQVPSRLTALGGGFAAGLLSATVGQPGIPIGLLMAWTRLDKRVVRGTMVTFLVVTQIFTVANLLWQNVMPLPALWTGLALMPFYLIGLAIGNRGFHLASQAAYRRILLGVLTVSAVTGVVNGISALLH